MLQDSNVQPLSQKHKRSLRNVRIQLKNCQEAFEGAFEKTRLKREVPKSEVSEQAMLNYQPSAQT